MLIKKTLKDYEGVDINTLTLQEINHYLDLKKAILEVKKVSNSSEPQYYIGRRVFAALRDEKE